MAETIDGFNAARTPYADGDMIGLGIGSPPTPTYQGNLLNLFAYIQKKIGTGQITFVGNVNYVMTTSDVELVTTQPLAGSPSWTLVPANSLPAGTRRRFVDINGVCSITGNQIAISPVGGDRIDGLSQPLWLADTFSFAELETNGSNNWTIVNYGKAMMRQDNLAGLPNVSLARSNLGLGTASLKNTGDLLQSANNLSDLTNVASARANLGIQATTTVTYAMMDPNAIATSAQIQNNTLQKLLDTGSAWASQVPVAIPITVTTGTPNTATSWNFGTFVNGTWNIPSTAPSALTLLAPSGVKAGQHGFVIIRNQKTLQITVTWPAAFNLVPSTATTTTFNPSPAANLLEYWVETPSLVRTRVTNNI